jgi:hypothetical protein
MNFWLSKSPPYEAALDHLSLSLVFTRSDAAVSIRDHDYDHEHEHEPEEMRALLRE